MSARTFGVDMTSRLETYRSAENAAYEAYRSAERPARTAYDAIQAPAWRAVVPLWEAALESELGSPEHRAFDEAHAAYEAVRGPAWEIFHAARESAWKVYEQRRGEAWRAVFADATDPLVMWIGQNAESRPDEAMVVLDALPATLADLDEIARREDWCQTWDSFRADAIADGVIEEESE